MTTPASSSSDTRTKMPISRPRHNGGRGRRSGPRPCREGDAPGGRSYLPLPFVQLWRHAPSKDVAALLLRTQRLLVCH
jgi:hypothetical protein